MKKDITRAIIDATVDRGLREIYEDPRRSIRKLADLGKMLNKNKPLFKNELYDIFQELLRNDDSPYYVAIEHLLRYTSRKNLKDFGINMGYNSFYKGKITQSKLRESKNLDAPWGLVIRMDPEIKTGITPSGLIPFIAECKKFGIHSFAIRLENNISYFEDLLKLFITYDDCAFFFMLPDREINREWLPLVGACSNVLYLLPAFGDSCGTNVHMLKKEKAWTGLYAYYDESDTETIISPDSVSDYLPQECSFLFFIAKDGVSPSHIEKTALRVRQMRTSPAVPLFLFDIYGDMMQIQRMMGGNEFFYEILADGTIRTESGEQLAKDTLLDLEKLFRSRHSSNG